MTRINKVAVVAAFALISTTALAQGVRTEKNMSLALANEAAAAAVEACAAKGYLVSAAVVDRAGQLKALHRADGAGPHTLSSSRRKAYTAASVRDSTTALMEIAQKNPGAANLGQINGFLLLGGGLPIRAGNEVIGAIGVGGAPGGHLDDQCAEAGIAKIKDRLN